MHEYAPGNIVEGKCRSVLNKLDVNFLDENLNEIETYPDVFHFLFTSLAQFTYSLLAPSLCVQIVIDFLELYKIMNKHKQYYSSCNDSINQAIIYFNIE